MYRSCAPRCTYLVLKMEGKPEKYFIQTVRWNILHRPIHTVINTLYWQTGWRTTPPKIQPDTSYSLSHISPTPETQKNLQDSDMGSHDEPEISLLHCSIYQNLWCQVTWNLLCDKITHVYQWYHLDTFGNWSWRFIKHIFIYSFWNNGLELTLYMLIN